MERRGVGAAVPTFGTATVYTTDRLDLKTILEASFSFVDGRWNQNEMVFNLAPEDTFSKLRAL